MDKYYYFIALLPTLSFPKEPAISVEDFLEESEKWLSEKDQMILSGIDINIISIGNSSELYYYYQ